MLLVRERLPIDRDGSWRVGIHELSNRRLPRLDRADRRSRARIVRGLRLRIQNIGRLAHLIGRLVRQAVDLDGLTVFQGVGAAQRDGVIVAHLSLDAVLVDRKGRGIEGGIGWQIAEIAKRKVQREIALLGVLAQFEALGDRDLLAHHNRSHALVGDADDVRPREQGAQVFVVHLGEIGPVGHTQVHRARLLRLRHRRAYITRIHREPGLGNA